ncbi:MAG: UvrD-helicase domain-containing protein, partial [Gammaproteobacteria bacterium]
RRRRLLARAGDDARRVTVLTYHAMALRLTGTSLETASRTDTKIDFDRLIENAIALLNGESDEAFLDDDETRERLLQGYEYIFVDEYQDIDAKQYELIAALAGRRLNDPDANKLHIMAVGDDDQNIYAFKGANVEFIRRFQADYAGEVTYLVENFRSTQNIIAAANHVIQCAAERMKVDHPIRIDQSRAQDPPGGRWQALDPVHQGRVRSIAAPASANLQAQVVMQEVQRILAADPGTPLDEIAVLARAHRALEPLRALCEDCGLRFEQLSSEGARSRVSFMQLREGWQTAQALPGRRSDLVELAHLRDWLAGKTRQEPDNPHWADIAAAVEEFAQGSLAEHVTAQEVLDALYEAAGDARRHGRPDALRLLTAHGAKGLEYDHVIVMDCGDWGWNDDERRLLYVAMTRARQTLVLLHAEAGSNVFLGDLGSVDGVVEILPPTRPTHRPDLDRRYVTLGPAEVDLGYAGRQPAGAVIHADLAAVRVGEEVCVANRQLRTADGRVLGALARKCEMPDGPSFGIVHAVMIRTRAQTHPDYLAGVKVDAWEVPLVEVVIP